jgi:signal transduction histidine kinase
VNLPGALARPSLARRLVILALGWSLAALLISAVVLSLGVQQVGLRRTDESLAELIDQLLTGTTIENGVPFAPVLTDLRASRAYSGRYWQILVPTAGGGLQPVGQQSYSLFGAVIPTPPDLLARLKADPSEPVAYDTRGPQGEAVRTLARYAEIQGVPVIFVYAEDRSSIDRDIRYFIVWTAGAFILLGAGLVAAIVVQVRVGLRPLFALRREVAEVRRGKAERLAGSYPSEVAPLADELNALLVHNQEVVERQRTHVGNLAHALKTPISVMVTEASQRPGPLAEVVTRQAETMQRQVDHHLRRARAAARTQGMGERTSVAEVVDELARTLERIFRDKGVAIDWDVGEDLFFQGERQDLLEIAGNAMENACKWCKAKVRVRAEPAGAERFRLTIEDDGPGLPPDLREEVIRRGARLDENAPGSGLGLAILDELGRAYGGSLKLGDAQLGGLLVQIDLPQAEA